MRELSHENIDPFVGCCVDSPNACILTIYCPKGSLEVMNNDCVFIMESDHTIFLM